MFLVRTEGPNFRKFYLFEVRESAYGNFGILAKNIYFGIIFTEMGWRIR